MHKLIRAATIASLAALLFAAQNTASIAQPNSPDEIRNAVECVQKQLNGLGYEIGIVTGMVDDKTLAAGKEYVADMKRQDPNWANPLDITNNFYENVFMIFRKPDAERAYDILIDYAGLSELNV